MNATTPYVEIDEQITPCIVTGPGTPTALGGTREPVSWVHVPDPLGLSSHSSPALSNRKLPVTGSSTSSPRWMPTALPDGTSGIATNEPSELRRQSLFGATLPPP